MTEEEFIDFSKECELCGETIDSINIHNIKEHPAKVWRKTEYEIAGAQEECPGCDIIPRFYRDTTIEWESKFWHLGCAWVKVMGKE